MKNKAVYYIFCPVIYFPGVELCPGRGFPGGKQSAGRYPMRKAQKKK
jgi:hypothetical protein